MVFNAKEGNGIESIVNADDSRTQTGLHTQINSQFALTN